MVFSYELFGRLFVYLAIAIFSITGFTLLIGLYSFKRNTMIFPNLILFVLYLFYSPAKWICHVFSIKDTLVDEILVEVRNAVMIDKFKKICDKKVLILPQCMRHSSCQARCDPIVGYQCKECGKCDIGLLCQEARKYNFKVFVIPGDSFVKKIMRSYKPNSCIGVACFQELTESMQSVSKHIPVQGVFLLKDGCYMTTVDIEEVVTKMEMCDV
ncbi:DUF116 domain-containing protein [Methanosalsum natronophilum]|uniref:DUF116 domain-containing protein n=1 Tax=Methanosalsum natronophilum TaxID=768733 RepID=A0A3R7VTW5_9EURY|nr:DUF116 domain-containing protein [Methanosalsum natronophilum]MCS3922957.1 hypothetical protein [Methanosalsum natronophilum]RQD84890.1 MAG: DUF116 domain-containing protein [Methanosalsum natronophilum]